MALITYKYNLLVAQQKNGSKVWAAQGQLWVQLANIFIEDIQKQKHYLFSSKLVMQKTTSQSFEDTSS